MPKCGKPKKDGEPCTLNAMVGKDHCHLHPSAVEIEVRTDPVADVIGELMRLRKEEDYLIAKLTRMQDERDEIVEGTEDQLARERHGVSTEDLQKVQAAARQQFARRRQVQREKLDDFNQSLREEHRLSYTPTRTEMIPFGGVNWHFTAGKEWRYPRVVIAQFEEKCHKLDERERAKALLALGPDDDGIEFQRMNVLLASNK